MLSKTKNIEKQLLFEFSDETENESIDFRYVITSYGADYPVDSLIKRIKDEVIFVPPFQRQYVWNMDEASKFIESLILGLPVPGIFLSKEKDTNRLLVVDGQQRLLSLYFFYQGYFGKTPFRLQNVQEDLVGRSYSTLKANDRIRLDDSILHATVVRQDEPDDNNSSVYQIFERLNSGGRALKPQEIRACIYYGEFNELLNVLVKDINWRLIFGKLSDERLKEQELILRFFSLLYYRDKYEKPLKSFLNTYMNVNRDLQFNSRNELETIFKKTYSFIVNTIGLKPFRVNRNLNLGAFDAISIGIAERLKQGDITDTSAFKSAYNDLTNSKEFITVVQGGTSDEKNVEMRIEMAISTFKNLK
ncbi:DUF262 domain-containing protein [Pedobacter xixiisoli]|uniref:GmrSD restriction endonucleases N-terminal domain-containing protein n=1 Tax=Pedobacter xixiisoli TaxID=1476464 RepID=A0A285ZZP7_9SPHI|nr:DUF262 domain-containing protein [Pedobacter xixiisoli]SOD15136.1 Protein of unknown function DUF262 [Pedobacter xixiisoli]